MKARRTNHNRAEHSSPPARDFDAEIAQALQEAESLKPQMAVALDGWVDAAARWAADFWTLAVAKAVEENADVVAELGDAGRTSLKEETARLIENARPHIQRRLIDDRKADWPHLKPQTDPHDKAFRASPPSDVFDAADDGRHTGLSKSVPEAVAGRLSGVLGDLAAILAESGFRLSDFKQGDPYGHQGQWHAYRGHTAEWSDAMVERMAAYAALHRRYVDVLEERERISAERARAQAAALWDTA